MHTDAEEIDRLLDQRCSPSHACCDSCGMPLGDEIAHRRYRHPHCPAPPLPAALAAWIAQTAAPRPAAAQRDASRLAGVPVTADPAITLFVRVKAAAPEIRARLRCLAGRTPRRLTVSDFHDHPQWRIVVAEVLGELTKRSGSLERDGIEVSGETVSTT